MSKKKIQLILDTVALKTLETLKESTQAESMAHVLRDALGVYSSLHDLLKEMGPGAQLALIDRGRQEFQELNVPSLQGKHIVPGARAPIAIATYERVPASERSERAEASERPERTPVPAG